MDEELEVDPQRSELERLICVLTPLREHRQASAERAQRRAQAELAMMHDQLAQAQALLVQERINQRERRQELADAHLQQTLTLTEVDRWHDKERHMLDRLAKVRQDVDQQCLQIDAQQTLLEQVRQTAKARQRAVEKLACLSEAIHEEG
ncbi:type III secretion protein [Pseudomonas sp.]|uniref:type III secretion protein n=1 Tax=Pseudomonas sp. TaxID=306 RepID=UPI003FD7E5BC